jgi:F-type H+-transporting ATPase subunit b
MEIISKIALISINETLVVQVLSFLIFMVLMNRIMFRPLNTAMREREAYIDRMEADVAAAGKRLDDMQAQLKARGATMLREAASLKQSCLDEGGQEAAALVTSARDDIGRMKAAAARDAEEQMAAARQSLRAEADALSTCIIEKLLERRVAA